MTLFNFNRHTNGESRDWLQANDFTEWDSGHLDTPRTAVCDHCSCLVALDYVRPSIHINVCPGRKP